MVCKFCGAEYPDNAKACYHCHSENPLMTGKRKAEVLHAFDEEARQMQRDLPKKTVKRAHKILMIILAAIILLTFVIGALGIGISKSKEKVEYELIQHHISKMEELFQAGQIDALMEYYGNLSDRSYSYEKYGQIYDVGYFDRKWVFERYEDYCRLSETYQQTDDKDEYMRMRKEYLLWVFESGRDCLKHIYLYANDRVILGNESLLTAWKEELETFFLEEVGLTEEELIWLRTFEPNRDLETSLNELVEKIIERDDGSR